MNLRHHARLALGAIALLGLSACSKPTYDPTADTAAINASLQHLIASVNARDPAAIMDYYIPGDSLLVYDAVPPRQYVGAAAYKQD